MILAELHTGHFDFQALANDPTEAADLLREAWEVHAEQTGADLEYVEDALANGDVNFLSIEVGEVLRDGSRFRIRY